jgi:hypothetical protein
MNFLFTHWVNPLALQAFVNNPCSTANSRLKSSSVMNIKVINLLYMIHIKSGADAYETKTFNLRYLKSVIGIYRTI